MRLCPPHIGYEGHAYIDSPTHDQALYGHISRQTVYTDTKATHHLDWRRQTKYSCLDGPARCVGTHRPPRSKHTIRAGVRVRVRVRDRDRTALSDPNIEVGDWLFMGRAHLTPNAAGLVFRCRRNPPTWASGLDQVRVQSGLGLAFHEGWG